MCSFVKTVAAVAVAVVAAAVDAAEAAAVVQMTPAACWHHFFHPLLNFAASCLQHSWNSHLFRRRLLTLPPPAWFSCSEAYAR